MIAIVSINELHYYRYVVLVVNYCLVYVYHFSHYLAAMIPVVSPVRDEY